MSLHNDPILRSPFPGLTTHPTRLHRLFALLGDACGLALVGAPFLIVFHHAPAICKWIGI